MPEEKRKQAMRRFDANPRDTATPAGWAKLLDNICRKDALNRRCQTGEARLKGLLPAGAEVAHKTGTIGMSVDDVGILTLPDNAGRGAGGVRQMIRAG